MHPCAFTDSDLVVGYPDTNETLVISGDYSHQGRILVLNHGTLILDHADFNLRGDIYIWGNGALRVQGGYFTVVQLFAYQYGATVTDSGSLVFDSASVSYTGQSWSADIAGKGQLQVANTTLTSGFTTLSLGDLAQVDYTQSHFPSEYVILDSSTVRLADCDTALLWLGFPDSSVADFTLPATDTMIRHWEFPDSLPGVSGISYRIVLDSMTNVM
jgi:hypothetical protein